MLEFVMAGNTIKKTKKKMKERQYIRLLLKH
jgi:hypothetical protein